MKSVKQVLLLESLSNMVSSREKVKFWSQGTLFYRPHIWGCGPRPVLLDPPQDPHHPEGLSQSVSAQQKCPNYRKELGYFENFSNFTTIPFSCIYFCCNIVVTNAQNTEFRIFQVLLDTFGHFVQYKYFTNDSDFFLSVVLENTYLEQMARKGFFSFWYFRNKLGSKN